MATRGERDSGFWGKLALVGLSVLFSLALLEGAARVVLWLRPPVDYVHPWVYLAEDPPPYAGASYYSRAFVRESMRSLRSRWKPTNLRASLAESLPAGQTSHFKFDDVRGRHVNVIDGKRLTTDRPKFSRHRVWMFGGSTLFSARVPDRDTIASNLQRMLNDDPSRAGFGVANLGAPANATARMVQKLRRLAIAKDDVVIFYGGINDVFNPVFVQRYRRQLASEDNDGTVRRLNLVQRTMFDLRLYAGASAAVRLIFGVQFGVLPDRVSDDADLHEILNRAADEYRDLLVEADRYVKEHGGKFFNFLQPALYIQDDRTEYETWLVQNSLKATPGFERAFRVGYPMMRQAMAQTAEQGVASFDISDVLLAIPEGVEVYFDESHVNHVANEQIARRIYETVWEADGEGDASRN